MCAFTGGRGPAPRAETAPHKAEATAHSAPWNPGRAVATATAPPSSSANGRAFCRGAGPAPGARGSPRPTGAGAVTAVGQSALGSPEGLWGVWSLPGGLAKDGTLETIKEKEKPSVQAALSGWLGPRAQSWACAREEIGSPPGSAQESRGAPWPQASLGRGPERGSGSPGSQSKISQIRGEGGSALWGKSTLPPMSPATSRPEHQGQSILMN